MKAFFSRGYFCDACNVGYNDKSKHLCEKKCPCCHQIPPIENDNSSTCEKCNRYFRNSICFENHLKKYGSDESSVSVCEKFKRCKASKRHVTDANKKKHNAAIFIAVYAKKKFNDTVSHF